MREREGDDGGDERCVKIDGDSKKLNGLKTLKEMKEYLRSEWRYRNIGGTYLHFAAYLGDVDATKILLIEDKAEVNATDEDERTPMHFAALKGHADVAKVLIQNGADVNAVNDDNLTPLYYTARHGHVDVAKVLIQNGADVNAVTDNKWTTLHCAAWKGHVDVAKVLLQNGADVASERCGCECC